MSLARASPGWDSMCNQTISFSWGKTQMDLSRTQLSLMGDMEIHILQLLQGLSQVGEDTKALKHRGKLHLGNYFYKKLNQFCSSLSGSWAQALSMLILLHLQPVCCTHTLQCKSAQALTHFLSTAVDSKSFNKWHLAFWEEFTEILLDHCCCSPLVEG